ncbi:MAG: NTP transferase domain-containing protein [Pseudomonadota bacterium]
MPALTANGEHAADVLSCLNDWIDAGDPCALVVVTGTEGGAVRAPGALMAVSASSQIGYISGGCIDEDVALQARQAIGVKAAKALRYGAGSPFVDLPLPCGGAINVLIIPAPNARAVRHATAELAARRALSLRFSLDGKISYGSEHPQRSEHAFQFEYTPKLRLRIAGRGADPLALATIAQAAGYGIHLQCVDEEDIAMAHTAGIDHIEHLDTPSALRDPEDDAWTAFVLMFHDGTWEVPLVQQALSGDAFYVGAVGSQRTHSVRCNKLLEAGVSRMDMERVKGPIGLIPSLRDASMLAVSTLAEIIEAFPARSIATRPKTAVLMLAAGSASRFETGDKLLAPFNGSAVLEHSAKLKVSSAPACKIAVVAPAQSERAAILQNLGWTVLENPEAALGQSSSLARGMNAILERGDIEQVLIVLADMPNVSDAHFETLIKTAETTAISAVMSKSDDLLTPPALFKRQHFERLTELQGDQGAKAIFLAARGTGATVPLSAFEAKDIDTVQDLHQLQETVDA